MKPFNGPFIVSWIADWQRKLLEDSEEWCVDSTHKTCKSFVDSGRDSYLFTIVIKNKVTMKGVPVCFCITDKEVTNILVEWFMWIKESCNLNVKRIMIDCSQTEISAITQAFPEVNISLCHWHLKRAWENNIKKEIKIDKATHETKRAQEQARLSLNNMMHAVDEESFYRQYNHFKRSFTEFPVFTAYFDKYWLEKSNTWSKAWRPDATFHTNNLIESYHNRLKTFYLGRSRNLRVDRLVYMLTEIVSLDYRQDALAVFLGIKTITLTANEKKKKRRCRCFRYSRG